MLNSADIHLKSGVLAHYGLPDIAYPISVTALQSVIEGAGELPLAEMLHGLQLRASEEGAQWKQIESAMDRLAEMLAPDDARDVISAAGDHW